MRKIHISDSNAKNTFVYFAPIKPPKNPLKAFGKEKVFSKRLQAFKIAPPVPSFNSFGLRLL